MTSDDLHAANAETRAAWNANAAFWDERMGEGNDFFKLLEWPAVERLLDMHAGQKLLDVACGNGLTSRRLAALGAHVTAIDFAEELLRLAAAKPNPGGRIQYRTVDATDAQALRDLGAGAFDAALCNMALFDMADVQPLFRTLPELLKPGGAFVFSLTHPAFNNATAIHVGEELDDGGTIRTVYSVKVSKYMTASQAHGLAMRGQPRPQLYFDRPLQDYLNLGFRNGFVLDGFEECAYRAGEPQKNPLSWGGNFSEIPPVLVARLRLIHP